MAGEALWPDSSVETDNPGAFQPVDGDAVWRVVGAGGQPPFDDPGLPGIPWINTTGPFPALQFYRDRDSVVSITGVVSNLVQPIGEFGSRLFQLPVGYRPEFKQLFAGFTVWPFDAPTGIDPLLPGSVMWEGHIVSGVGLFGLGLEIHFVAAG